MSFTHTLHPHPKHTRATHVEALEEGAAVEVGLGHGVAGAGSLGRHPLAGAARDGGGDLQAGAEAVLVEAVFKGGGEGWMEGVWVWV